jgi:hypothetical protein
MDSAQNVTASIPIPVAGCDSGELISAPIFRSENDFRWMLAEPTTFCEGIGKRAADSYMR